MGNCCKKENQGNIGADSDRRGSHPSRGDAPLKAVSSDEKNALVRTVHSKTDFQTQLKEAGPKLVVLDFYATWCGPCRMIAPKIEGFAAQFPNVVFLKADVDENEEVAAMYGVNCMPTFIFFKNEAKVGEFSGANADKLKELIEEKNT